MKKYFTIFFAAFLLTTLTASSQLFQSYTAADAYDNALEQATDEIGDPILYLIGTGNMEINIGFPVKIEFDMEEGTSQMWLFSFKSAQDPTKEANIGVIKTLGSYQAFVLPADQFSLDMIPFNLSFPIPDGWMDSDEMIPYFTKSQEYKDFSAKYPDADSIFVALFTSDDITGITETFWGVNINVGQEFVNCGMHYTSGETFCEIVLPVYETEKISFKIFPNPAGEIINVTGDYSGNISIIDLYGNVVLSDESFDNSIDISALAPGVYYLRAGNSVSRFVKR
jgi:hypothetical protein